MYETERLPISPELIFLLDELDVDLIEMMLESQLEHNIFGELNPNPTNYLEILEENFEKIKEDDFYEEYKEEITKKIMSIYKYVEEKMRIRYSAMISLDEEYMSFDEYRNNIMLLYEFFYIRHYENLKTFFVSEILKNRKELHNLFKKSVDIKDIMVPVSKKIWKEQEFVTIFYNLIEIIKHLKDIERDMSKVTQQIIDLDEYEVTNYKLNKLLQREGLGLIFENEELAYKRFMTPLENDLTFYRLYSDVLEELRKFASLK